jgi:hypothetical protein
MPPALVSVIIGIFVLMGISMVITYAVSTPAIYIPALIILVAAVGGFIWMKVNKRSSNRV